MYGYRNNNVIRNFILTFAAGWLFGQVFTIQPKSAPFIGVNQAIQRSVK